MVNSHATGRKNMDFGMIDRMDDGMRVTLTIGQIRQLVAEDHEPGERWYRFACRTKDGWEYSFDVDAI